MKRGFHPTKPRQPGTVKACVTKLIEQVGGIERAMIRTGMSLPVIYAYSDPAAKDEISFAKVAMLTGPDAVAGVEFLATLAGGVFMPLPKSTTEVGQLTANAVRESGEAAAQLVQDLLDGVLTAVEARRALPELNEALQAFARLTSTVAAIARAEGEAQ